MDGAAEDCQAELEQTGGRKWLPLLQQEDNDNQRVARGGLERLGRVSRVKGSSQHRCKGAQVKRRPPRR